jgi:hypothetical protein
MTTYVYQQQYRCYDCDKQCFVIVRDDKELAPPFCPYGKNARGKLGGEFTPEWKKVGTSYKLDKTICQ